MNMAPEPFRSACLEVIYRAVIQTRQLAWGNSRLRNRFSKKRHEQIADLMNAIHNIPHLLQDWERCDQKLVRDFLVAHDEKWSAKGGLKLVEVYDNALVKPLPNS